MESEQSTSRSGRFTTDERTLGTATRLGTGRSGQSVRKKRLENVFSAVMADINIPKDMIKRGLNLAHFEAVSPT
jgi:hypothetical protein